MNRLKLAAPLAVLLLGGCLSFGPKVPATLFDLTPDTVAAPGSGTSGTLESAIVVLEPEAEQRLDVTRVPVQIDDANVAYVKDAMWIERPARLFQRLVAETLRAKGTRLVLEPEAEQRLDVTRVPVQIDDANVAYVKDAMWIERPARLFQRLVAETLRARGTRLVLDTDPGTGNTLRLGGRLLDMGFDARTSEAVVRFDAVRTQPGGRIDTKRFEERVPGVTAKPVVLGPALDRAANQVAAQVAEWVG